MNFLFVTEPDDVHSIVVSLILENLGHGVVNFFSADFPSHQKNSVFINKKEFYCKSENNYQVMHHVGYDVVWWRRPRLPYVPLDKVFKDDYRFLKRESRMFHDSFTQQIAPHAWWINRKDAALRANYKLLQLKVASDVGLTIPTTLCSNHLDEIMNFYSLFHSRGIIYKPLTYQAWDEGDGFRVCYTSKIDNIEILKESSISLYPGIYQELIPKKYELRITCFGDYIVAAKLNSQIHEDGSIDWRVLNGHGLSVEPYVLPELLKNQVRFLMRELGLAFGCLDFIVTPTGEYVFLEVNEQGQFLFLEQLCEDLPLLDIFIYYLLQQSVDYHWIKSKNLYKYSDFQEKINKQLAQNSKNHINVRKKMIDKT